MDLERAMRTAATVREFADEPVDDTTLRRILDNARFAPSGGNRQPWTVLAIKDPSLRRELRTLAQRGWNAHVAQRNAGILAFAPGPDGRWHRPDLDLAAAAETHAPSAFVDSLETVPVLLVVAVRLTALIVTDVELPRQSIIGGASIYPFVHNILLAARAEGLGGVPITFVVPQEPAVAALLGIPPDHGIAAMIPLGRPAREVTRLRRREVDEFTHVDTWTGPPLRA